MNLEDPVALVIEVAGVFERAGVPHALCGGMAVAVWGEPRETRDADHVALGPVEEAERALLGRFAWAKVAFRDVAFGGVRITRISVLPDGDDKGFNVIDLIVPTDPAYLERLAGRAVHGPLRGEEIPVVSPVDLILLKLLASRPRDIKDAASVLERSADLIDRALLEREIEALAASIPDHDIRGRWREVLSEEEARGAF